MKQRTVNSLIVFNETGEISLAWSGLVWSTMVGACKYGERLHRRFGKTYRILKSIVMKNNKYSIF